MLVEEREHIILSNINANGVATVRELAEVCDVTEVTIRRDLKRLEDNNLLKRTFGGAVSLERSFDGSSFIVNDTIEEPALPDADALIITPIRTRDAHTLRERAIRQQIPLIAEGDPQPDAVYVGIDNYRVAYELGDWTGQFFRHNYHGNPHLLDIGLSSFSTTTQRSQGFLSGLIDSYGANITPLSIDGGGTYNNAYQMAIDALRLHPEINIIFGINDDSILAGIQAHNDLGRDPSMLVAVAIGGEGKTIFNTLMQQGSLKACMAMFPEVTGRLIIDTILYLWQNDHHTFNIITPTKLVTADNIHQYYVKQDNEWQFNHDDLVASVQRPWEDAFLLSDEIKNKHISFSISYRTHEWYQNLTKAMQARAKDVGVKFSVVDVNDNLRAEVRELRRVIGKIAASYVKDGDTIILDAGTTTMHMSEFLKQHRNITVITNSPDIFQKLRANPDIQLILAGGEFDRQAQAFVGRNVHMLFEELKVDKAFIVAGGLSESFGLSSVHRSEAEVRRYMTQSAREVVVLADHTVMDVDSDFQVTRLDNIDTLVTDVGILSSQKLAYAQLGLKLLIAGQVTP